MSPDGRPTLLITGAAGGLASVLAETLGDDYRLVGVDPRGLVDGANFPGKFIRVDYNHRRMAEVFRSYRFDALVHLGRVRSAERVSNTFRYNLNVLGTRNLLKLGLQHGIRKFIVFSTFHVYGAHQHNHLYITEDEPLRASQIFPELYDAIELDHAATTFLWRNPGVQTIVLRPTNVVGPDIQNTITNFLRARPSPKLLGFDPLQQFIHQSDVARALKLCLASDRSGVYNVAGEGVVPYARAIELAGSYAIPVPAPLAYSVVGLLERFRLAFPRHLIDYFKFPTVISDAAFRRDFGYEPSVTTADALRGISTR